MTTPQDIQKLIIYRDAMMLVLNKPAGIAVHAGTSKHQSLDAFFDDLRFGLNSKPELVHRLDSATSGCLILGRHRQALIRLGKMFEDGSVEKIYWAIVSGVPEQKEGTIDLPLAKQSDKKNQWWMKVDLKGKSALTEYQVLGSAEGLSWLALKPRTGRTHQLRVHCAAIGCPILGDTAYGNCREKQPFKALHLHAYSVQIPLYPKKDPILVQAPPPEHMQDALKLCGYST